VVACASTLEWPFAAVASTETVDESTLEVTSEGQEILWRLVESSGDTLDTQQKHNLFNLL